MTDAPCVACGKKPRVRAVFRMRLKPAQRKKIEYCRKCALANGYRACSACSRLFLPDRRAQRRCPKCGPVTRVVGGGLPELGKRS
jgi:hypothetical protein